METCMYLVTVAASLLRAAFMALAAVLLLGWAISSIHSGSSLDHAWSPYPNQPSSGR